MKHNTHIYIAAKAIELIRQSVDNTIDEKGKHLKGTNKGKERKDAAKQQRILQYYQEQIEEGSWAPDDILHDNDPFHIFKLFTDKEFPGHTFKNKPQYIKDKETYYKFAGGLPYKIDHIAQQIISMSKLRDFNDQFDLKQIMYMYMLLSHYLADAHVPMHCDLRDDPPSKRGDKEPSRRKGTGKPKGKYMKSSAHGSLEGIWDEAVTPVAIEENIIAQTWGKEKLEKTEYSDIITFSFKDCKKDGDVKVPIIPSNGLMDFMVDVCIESKKRGQQLFPIDNPKKRKDEILPEITRKIFADSIGNLLAVWRYIWIKSKG
ncbi:hypothetical protein ACFL57_04340 [Candidatus Margulisiibacteriota bacterium]